MKYIVPVLTFLLGYFMNKFMDFLVSKFDFLIKEYPSAKLRKEYNEGITSDKYIKWELGTLKGIYGKDISFVRAFGKEFPCYVVQGADTIKFPFKELTNVTNLDNFAKIDYTKNPLYNQFKKIVSPYIHHPNLFGYASNGFITENNCIKGIKATPRTYNETVYTCHILHYELWNAYKRLGKKRFATLDDLPIRKAIHKDHDNLHVILSGCNRSALNDVAIAVIDHNEVDNIYEIATAIRSENVATYPQYFGFVPSGGFELYELEDKQTDTVIKSNFSVIGALYREYIEELFGEDIFDKPTGNDDLNRLLRNQKIQDLVDGVSRSTYHFEFLGVCFDLITLRQTLSFVLRIDDRDFFYKNEIRHNSENVSLDFIPLKTFEEFVNKIKFPIMTETAGIYALLKDNHLYKEIVDNNYKLIKTSTARKAE